MNHGVDIHELVNPVGVIHSGMLRNVPAGDRLLSMVMTEESSDQTSYSNLSVVVGCEYCESYQNTALCHFHFAVLLRCDKGFTASQWVQYLSFSIWVGCWRCRVGRGGQRVHGYGLYEVTRLRSD